VRSGTDGEAQLKGGYTGRRAGRITTLALWLFLPHFIALSLHHSPAWPASPELRSPLGQAQRAFQLQGAHYGTLPDDHPAVLRARDIFRKVVRVAGGPPAANVSLYVLATPKIIAQSYEQGIIVVSLGLLDRVQGDDDALAFILGHEIAHQTRGHQSLLSGFGVQSSPGSPPAVPVRPDLAKTFQVLELDADRFGVLYTSLAGYRARAAIAAIGTVAEALGADPLHPDPRQRAREIRRQIAEVLDHHEAYLLGLAYLAMERLEGAARIFEEFQNLYPSRELFLNLGVAYHKLALRYGADDGFQRSILIDPRSRITVTFRGTDQPVHPLFTQYLERATEAYKHASAMDPDDPVAHTNLGVAYLDAGQFEYALGEFRAALKADAGFVAAYNNRGITYAKVGDLKRAEADLLEAAAKDPRYVPAFRNLVLVYQRLGNAAESRKAEEALARLERVRTPAAVPPGPVAIGGIRPGMPWAEAEQLVRGQPSRQISIPLSVTPGDELILRVHGPQGIAVAVEKGLVAAVGVQERGAARLPNGVDLGVSVDRLRQAYGTPARIEGVREISLWVYPDHGLVAFVANGKVTGLWAVSRGTE